MRIVHHGIIGFNSLNKLEKNVDSEDWEGFNKMDILNIAQTYTLTG